MSLQTGTLLIEVLGTATGGNVANSPLLIEVLEGIRGPVGPQGVPGWLPPVTLADAAVIAVPATSGSLMRVTLGGNRALGNPTGGLDSQTIMFELKQDATGGRLLTLQSKYHFGTDLTSITLSTGAGITDRLLVQYVAARDQWDVIGFKKGF